MFWVMSNRSEGAGCASPLLHDVTTTAAALADLSAARATYAGEIFLALATRA
jgi:hypothetical protein